MRYKSLKILDKVDNKRIEEMKLYAYALYFIYGSSSETEMRIREEIKNLPNFSVTQSDVNKLKSKINANVDYVLLETVADIWHYTPNRMLYILYALTPRGFNANDYLLKLISEERQWYRNYYRDNKKKGVKSK